ncbi:hypothetical protein Anas_05551 [Armadillidium nasatum]|uniref:Uncharacterized protein n=1 Tax=Armadillidium nasatum TaxID=96803 RepID=A0A5N5SXZ1_9CRUS|nr:hypothetical protein Anas_05551 [Armadillidium nasatum]
MHLLPTRRWSTKYTVLILWISLGSFLYKKPLKFLSFSSDECDYSNFTSENTSVIKEFAFLSNSSVNDLTTDESFISSLYQVSYTLYVVVGPLLCILIAVIVSFITGNQKSHETSPKFICPYVQEISLLEKEKEDKPLSYNRNVDENHFEKELVNLPKFPKMLI